MAAHKERLVVPGTLDPAPAGSGFGMVELREVHHVDAPPSSRARFWHAFSSIEELLAFLSAQLSAQASAQGREPVLAMRSDARRRTQESGSRTFWSTLTHRHQSLLKRLSHPNLHREPPNRVSTRH